MKRIVYASLLCIALAAGPGAAEPRFRISYPGGVPRVEISGDWNHSHYTVWRAPAAAGPFTPISDTDVLCVGPCYADDYGVEPGRTYFYRFDVFPPADAPQTFGPFAALISREARLLSARLSPNPGRGPARVTLFRAARPGTSVAADASVFDLQGRRVARLFHGPLGAGNTSVDWDGRGADGREIGGGIYLLRVAAADGRSFVTRVVRSR